MFVNIDELFRDVQSFATGPYTGIKAIVIFSNAINPLTYFMLRTCLRLTDSTYILQLDKEHNLHIICIILALGIRRKSELWYQCYSKNVKCRINTILIIIKLNWCNSLKIPQAHGRNLLSIDYDRNTRTEKVYDDHRKFTLRIIYDAQGRPATWLPSSSLALVNVSYSPTGRLVGLQRGSMSEKSEFDTFGRILSRTFVDGKVWSFSYLDKVIYTWTKLVWL